MSSFLMAHLHNKAIWCCDEEITAFHRYFLEFISTDWLSACDYQCSLIIDDDDISIKLISATMCTMLGENM